MLPIPAPAFVALTFLVIFAGLFVISCVYLLIGVTLRIYTRRQRQWHRGSVKIEPYLLGSSFEPGFDHTGKRKRHDLLSPIGTAHRIPKSWPRSPSLSRASSFDSEKDCDAEVGPGLTALPAKAATRFSLAHDYVLVSKLEPVVVVPLPLSSTPDRRSMPMKMCYTPPAGLTPKLPARALSICS